MTISLLSHIAESAARQPHAIALEAPGRKPATYEFLLAQITATANWLAVRGIARNDRVAVVMANGAEMASLFLGVSSVATCAPLNPAYRAGEFEFYLSDLKPKVVIVDGAMESPVRDVARAAGIAIIELHRRDQEPAGSCLLDSSLPAVELAAEYASGGDVALVLHTSGTTSRPKIVPLTHENLCVSAANIVQSLGLTKSDRCLNIMPLFHVHGLVGAMLSSLFAGASVVCTPGYQATEFYCWLAEFHPTWYTGVPTMHHGILTRAESNRAVIAGHQLRFIRSCSAALAPQMMEELEQTFGVPVVEAYGMTEAAHQMSCNCLPPLARKPGSVGTPTGVEIAIMDEAGLLLPTDTVGEVVIRGRSVTSGYQSNPEANLKSFTNGWFRTGDQGRLDSDGYLFLTGRIKELIVRAGEKIAPREIDEVLLSHSAVAQALAFAVPDAVLGERVAAAVVLKADAAVTELELCEYAAQLLADFKVPEKIVFVPEIPKGPTGKQQRIGLAGKLGLDCLSADSANTFREFCAPGNSTETALAQMWTEVLKLDRVGIHDNFFAAGGDSILAGQLIVRIRAVFGVELSAPRLFQLPTVALLAEFIAKQSSNPPADSTLPTANRAEGLQLTAAQQRMWFHAASEPESPIYHRPYAFLLKGSLDAFRLQMSLNAVARRRELLRTNYRERNGILEGFIQPPQPVFLSVEDLSRLSETQRESAALQWMQDETARKFDLENESVVRFGLARLAPDEHLFLLVMHHIACDASTIPVLVEEIADAYNGTASAPITAQYADYAVWQCAREADAKKTQLDWWRKQLAGVAAAGDIPCDFERPQRSSNRGGSVPVQVDAAAMAQLKSAARAANTTVFTVLFATFNLLVHRCTQADDLVVGTPVSIRNHPAAERMAGLFINTLAIRTSATGDPTFSEFLDRARESVTGALAHQEVPFDAVVNALRAECTSARPSLLQVVFEYRNIGKPNLEMNGIVAEPVEFDAGFKVVPFDLMLDVEPCSDGLRGHFYYDADLFERATVERMATQFLSLVHQSLATPDERISQLCRISEEERAQLLQRREKAGFDASALPPRPIEEQAENHQMPAPALENAATKAECTAPRTPTETQLAVIWQESLGVQRVGVEENFFDLGGHSLSALRVVARIRNVFSQEIPVACLFQHPTIASLAAEMDGMRIAMHSDEDLLRILDEIDAMPTSNLKGN